MADVIKEFASKLIIYLDAVGAPLTEFQQNELVNALRNHWVELA